MKKGLAYDDVLLVPQYSEVLPKDTDISSNFCGLKLNLPVISSAMDTVTETAMAIAMAECGGVGVVHQNMSKEQQLKKIGKVKGVRQGRLRMPLTVAPDEKVFTVAERLADKGISGAPVVHSKGYIAGMITQRDILTADPKSEVHQVMTCFKELVYGTPDMSDKEYLEEMIDKRIEKLPILKRGDGENFRLLGLVTKKDLMDDRPLTLDDSGRYAVGAALGMGDINDMTKHVFELQKKGIDFVVLDSAHGDSKGIISALGTLSEEFHDLRIVVGNIVTAQAAKRIWNACYDPDRLILKVGIGPGSICTTRSVAGVGYPQFSALWDIAKCIPSAQIIADGGINKTGSLPKALLHSGSVMLGSMLAGTDECPGSLVDIGGKMYKRYRGMGSIEAMEVRKATGNRYSQKKVAEGVSSHVTYKGSVKTILATIDGALRGSFGYLGVENMSELHELGAVEDLDDVCVELTNSGLIESNVSRDLIL